MPGTAGQSCLSDPYLRRCRDSLFVAVGMYQRRADGQWRYEGTRPGPGWHGHGYFRKQLTVLQDGSPVQIRVYKHRWRLDPLDSIILLRRAPPAQTPLAGRWGGVFSKTPRKDASRPTGGASEGLARPSPPPGRARDRSAFRAGN